MCISLVFKWNLQIVGIWDQNVVHTEIWFLKPCYPDNGYEDLKVYCLHLLLLYHSLPEWCNNLINHAYERTLHIQNDPQNSHAPINALCKTLRQKECICKYKSSGLPCVWCNCEPCLGLLSKQSTEINVLTWCLLKLYAKCTVHNC